jgi:eukaryotic-like serine/threonine-protein kinase
VEPSRGVDGPERASTRSLPTDLSALVREVARGAAVEDGTAWDLRLAPGVRVGRFEMVREVGRGGFGIVYEARDVDLGRTVAFKAMRGGARGGAAPERIEHEAEVAAGLSHPNVATLYDVGRCEEGPYLVFEFLQGETLRQRLKRGPLPVPEAIRVAVEACRGVAYAHANGVVHRDLSPANVFLCADGGVKLLDLGMARAFGRRPASGGTPGHMAPEQARGGPEDERTDVFGLGLLLFEMLAGKPPFPRGKPVEAPAPILEVPGFPAIGELVGSMIATDPVARPRDGERVLEALLAVQRTLADAPGPPPPPVVRRPMRVPAVRPWVAAMAVVLLAAAGFAAWTVRPPSRGPHGRPIAASIAVLPFTDLSPGRDHGYLADGISEEILTWLSRLEGLRVPGRTSSFAWREARPPLADLGRALGVNAVLDGSVRMDGKRIRVAAQVVSVHDGFPLWSGTFESDFSDVFALQDEIARAVASSLQLKMLGGSGGVARYVATSPEAYQHLLRARELHRRYTATSLPQAAEEYRRALAADPDYAPALAGLGKALYIMASWEPTPEGVQRVRRQAREVIEKAVSLAPELPDALAMRALVRQFMDRDREGARADLEGALARDGANPDTRRSYSMLLGAMGRIDEAVEQARIAADLDPVGLSVGALGRLYMVRGQLDRAEFQQRRHLQVEPGNLPSLLVLGQTLLLQGRPAEALSIFQQMPVEEYRLFGTALALHSLGRAEESNAALARLTATSPHASAFEIGTVHAWRGERSEALDWLERALEQEEIRVFELPQMEPLLASLRGNPRFEALAARVAMPVR